MQTIHDRLVLRQQLSKWREAGERIAVVPTMGSLHAGHLSLVRIAKDNADRVVVTVFVNPTQFGDGEDFDTYPRSLESDAERLSEEEVDVLFAPDVAAMYPFGTDNAARVIVPGLTEAFCGQGRRGHFDGVTSVVARIFALVQPDIAVFGQKDFQQQLVIRRMVEDLGLPVEILLGPVVREASGLAMSSRNAYLTDTERRSAAEIYRTLAVTADALTAGDRDYAELEAKAVRTLSQSVKSVEYLAIRHSSDLSQPAQNSNQLVVLIAAHVGDVRLIDNVLVSCP